MARRSASESFGSSLMISAALTAEDYPVPPNMRHLRFVTPPSPSSPRGRRFAQVVPADSGAIQRHLAGGFMLVG